MHIVAQDACPAGIWSPTNRTHVIGKLLGHFQLSNSDNLSKENEVANTLSHMPQAHAITTTHHDELTAMKEQYKDDLNFSSVWTELNQGGDHKGYYLSDGYLWNQNQICVTKNLRPEVIEE